tara:strand:- start:1507 stop:2214 length:708 start_codon:yes stop_codon:yes gene_type:complete
MISKTSKNQEFDHFSKIAAEWWDPEGKFKILHNILPLRIEYILKNFDNKKIKNLEILDLGCGGGLTCEPLSRLGAKVTGLDFVKENIEIAKLHALQSNLNIKYVHKDLDLIDLKKKYNVILILEVLEHLDNWENLIKKIRKNLKKDGLLIISTINQTQLAKIFAIFMAENVLKWIPKDTHHYKKLIKPDNLKKILIKNNLSVENTEGLNFNPISREWSLSKNLLPINYFCTAKLI